MIHPCLQTRNIVKALTDTVKTRLLSRFIVLARTYLSSIAEVRNES